MSPKIGLKIISPVKIAREGDALNIVKTNKYCKLSFKGVYLLNFSKFFQTGTSPVPILSKNESYID